MDLSDAYLSRANLRGVNLFGANLGGADLKEADLTGARLNQAHLKEADLSNATLNSASLTHASMGGADLTHAYLCDSVLISVYSVGADFRYTRILGADFTGANLGGVRFFRAHLSNSILRYAELGNANFSCARLDESDLSDADLNGANLRGAILSGVNLSRADLSEADLTHAILQNAMLHASRLIDAKLDEANLTDACLWETQRAGWSIKDIICESVYWDEEGKEKTIYATKEFERLFADQTKIKLFYKDGISPLEIATLPALIKHLEEAHPGCGLRLVSIHDDAGGAVVELAIGDGDQHSPAQLKQLQAALETEAQQRLEYQRQALIEREARLQLEGEVRQLDSMVDKLIRHHRINIHRGGHMGDKYDISGQAGAVGPNAHAHDMTFNQIWNQVQNSIDLSKLAKELSVLRQELKKDAVEPEHDISVSEVAKAEQAAKTGNGAKALEHLKSAGKWALDAATKIGTSLAVEAIKKSMGT